MIPWTDTRAGRIRNTINGAIIAIIGTVLIVTGFLKPIGIGLALIGIGMVVWAWVHKTRSGFPPGYVPREPSPREHQRWKRESELREMLNDPERRGKLDQLLFEYTKGVKPKGVSTIKAILNHEFGEEDRDSQS